MESKRTKELVNPVEYMYYMTSSGHIHERDGKTTPYGRFLWITLDLGWDISDETWEKMQKNGEV